MKTMGYDIAALACLLLLACGGSKEAPTPEPAPQPAAEPAAAEPAPAAEEAEPSPEEVPVTADFEEEAEQEITDDNYVAELDKLEAELDEAAAE